MINLDSAERMVRLAPLTTYQIGGPADYFLVVHSADELVNAVQAARLAALPFFVLGTGANILISDAGIRGLVIHNQANQATINGQQLTAASGATIADLITISTEANLSGLEHFAGIPSSVGGALWQNLHFLAPNRQATIYIADVLEYATLLDEQSKQLVVDRDFFRFGYDDSILHHRSLVVLDATFQLTAKPRAEIERQIQENLTWRRAKQPQLDEFASCGSVFKKIEGVGAGRLIDRAGLKGKSVGQVQVSEKNANYLANPGSATAAEVRQLIELIQREVKTKTGYWLEPEIGFVGEWGEDSV